MAGRFVPFSPPSTGDLRSPNSIAERDLYLSELLAERQKLGPFLQVLPNCSRILNQEIVRVTTLPGSAPFLDQDTLDHASPISSNAMLSKGAAGGEFNGLNGLPHDVCFSSFISVFLPMFSSVYLVSKAHDLHLHAITERFGAVPRISMSWLGTQGGSTLGSPVIKKTQRINIPIDKHPNFNFVGRILGPRGNSLKRVEATTGCRVLIRGRGSIKDNVKEDKLRDKPGFEHLNEPLHVLVEAEFPTTIIDTQLAHAKEILEELLKPVEETCDVVKKAQLRELAILNGTLREDGPSFTGLSSLTHSGPSLKRAKIQH